MGNGSGPRNGDSDTVFVGCWVERNRRRESPGAGDIGTADEDEDAKSSERFAASFCTAGTDKDQVYVMHYLERTSAFIASN